jgi:hypothetical protein
VLCDEESACHLLPHRLFPPCPQTVNRVMKHSVKEAESPLLSSQEHYLSLWSDCAMEDVPSWAKASESVASVPLAMAQKWVTGEFPSLRTVVGRSSMGFRRNRGKIPKPGASWKASSGAGVGVPHVVRRGRGVLSASASASGKGEGGGETTHRLIGRLVAVGKLVHFPKRESSVKVPFNFTFIIGTLPCFSAVWCACFATSLLSAPHRGFHGAGARGVLERGCSSVPHSPDFPSLGDVAMCG